MSRNKTILLIIVLLLAYFFVPNSPTTLFIKGNAKALLPYAAILLVVYLAVSVSLLRKALNQLIVSTTDENVARVVKRLRYTFDVKRIFGAETLKKIYNQVNISKKVSTKSKEDLYGAMRRKRLDVAPPLKGRS